MKNEHMYKKLKYKLTLSYMYNINKYHRPDKQTIWHMCQYFNVKFNQHMFWTIIKFEYYLNMRICRDTWYRRCNDKMLMDYANTNNISIYDMKEHKIINPVYNILI